MKWVFDLAVIAAFVIGISVNAKRGFVKSVLLVAGYALSVGLAAVISAEISEGFYDSYLQNGVTKKIREEAAELDSAVIINEKLFDDRLGIEVSDGEVREAVLKEGKLSENLFGLALEKKADTDFEIIEKFLDSESFFESEASATIEMSSGGSNFEQAVRLLAEEDEISKAEKLHTELVRPVLVKATRWIAAFVLFVLISTAVSFMASKAGFVNRIPVAGTLNTVLGGCIGLAEAAVIVLVLGFVTKAAVLMSGGNGSLFNEEIINDTVLFKLIYALF